MQLLSFTNTTGKAAREIGDTFDPDSTPDGVQVGWVPMSAMERAGLPGSLRGAACRDDEIVYAGDCEGLNDGYAVLYRGEFDQDEAARLVVDRLTQSMETTVSDFVLEAIPEALPVLPDLTFDQRRAVLMALVIAAERHPRKPGFLRDLRVAYAKFQELGW
jgi:hypothetical protein